MRDTWLDSQGDSLEGAGGLTARHGSKEEGSALVRESLEAHGGPRDRVYFVFDLSCM